MDDASIEINCWGLLVALIMIIPHYLLMCGLIIAEFSRSKQNLFIKWVTAIFTCSCLVLIIPITFCMDFWLLAVIYSNNSFIQATDMAFVKISAEVWRSPPDGSPD